MGQSHSHCGEEAIVTCKRSGFVQLMRPVVLSVTLRRLESALPCGNNLKKMKVG